MLSLFFYTYILRIIILLIVSITIIHSFPSPPKNFSFSSPFNEEETCDGNEIDSEQQHEQQYIYSSVSSFHTQFQASETYHSVIRNFMNSSSSSSSPSLSSSPFPSSSSTSTSTDTYAILLSASRYWFNYRHSSNVLSIYSLLKELGIPDDHILLFVADDHGCNSRNPYLSTLYQTDHNYFSSVYSNSSIETDYQGYEVTPDNFLKAINGRDNMYNRHPRRRITPDRSSNLLIYLTGHGGDGFLKFHDKEELSYNDFATTIMDSYYLGRYKQCLIISDTCQAATITNNLRIESSLSRNDNTMKNSSSPLVYGISLLSIIPSLITDNDNKEENKDTDEYAHTPGTLVISSSIRDQNSYAIGGDAYLGLSLADGFTYTIVQQLQKTWKIFDTRSGSSVQVPSPELKDKYTKKMFTGNRKEDNSFESAYVSWLSQFQGTLDQFLRTMATSSSSTIRSSISSKDDLPTVQDINTVPSVFSESFLLQRCHESSLSSIPLLSSRLSKVCQYFRRKNYSPFSPLSSVTTTTTETKSTGFSSDLHGRTLSYRNRASMHNLPLIYQFVQPFWSNVSSNLSFFPSSSSSSSSSSFRSSSSITDSIYSSIFINLQKLIVPEYTIGSTVTLHSDNHVPIDEETYYYGGTSSSSLFLSTASSSSIFPSRTPTNNTYHPYKFSNSSSDNDTRLRYTKGVHDEHVLNYMSNLATVRTLG